VEVVEVIVAIVVAEIDTVSGTSKEEHTAEREVEATEVVAVEDGEIEEIIEVPLLLVTIDGRSPVSPLRGTMEVATGEEVAVMIGVEVAVTGEVLGRATPRTGPSLCPGTRGWRRSCSTLDMGPLASTLKGTRIFLWR